MQNNLEQITVEVRKAYRFLFEYQKHILDLMSFIGDAFKLKYVGGYPMFSDPSPKRGYGFLSNWSWDWLNMYYYQFAFQQGENEYLSVFLINDTGYYVNKNETKKEGKEDRLYLENFQPVELSETKLIFVANRGEWKTEDWQSKGFILFTGETVENYKTGTMIYKSYVLSDFETEERAIESLKSFSEFCQKKHIPICYIEKTV